MAWTTPATFTTGNVLTAAQLNTNVRDNTNFLFDPPMVLATRTTAQSIPNATSTGVLFTATDIYDTDTMHDPSGAPGNIVINTAGVYDLWASVEWAANATGMRRTDLQVSTGGARKLAFQTDSNATSGQNSAQSLTGTWKFTAADTASINVFQNSTASLNLLGTTNTGSDIDGGSPACYMGASWVGSGV